LASASELVTADCVYVSQGKLHYIPYFPQWQRATSIMYYGKPVVITRGYLSRSAVPLSRIHLIN